MLSQGKLDALRLLLRPVTFNLDPLKLVPPGTNFSTHTEKSVSTIGQPHKKKKGMRLQYIACC